MKSKPNEVVNVLEEFFSDHMPNSRGLSENTITAYQYAFRLLFDYLDKNKDLTPEKVTFQSLSNGLIEEFLTHLETERKCSVQTRNIRRAAIKAFAKFAAKKAFTLSLSFYSEVMGIDKKKEPKQTIIKYFTKDEIALLLKLPKTNRLIGQRDVTMLAMLYATGARATELCDIQLKDITLATPTSPTKIRLFGKGNKTRFVTIPDTCTAILKGYLQSKNYDTKNEATYERHLFSSQTNEHMSLKCVEEVVKKYVTMAKTRHKDYFRQGNYTPHSFRHSIAVHMLENGESLIAIKAFLGHASISTTTIYAQVTPELANKYLDERGKPLENATIQSVPQSIPEALPFLYRKVK
jgi:site-specific recombinase XerD